MKNGHFAYCVDAYLQIKHEFSDMHLMISKELQNSPFWRSNDAVIEFIFFCLQVMHVSVMLWYSNKGLMICELLEGGSSRPALSFIFVISVLYSLSSQILPSLESATLLMPSLSRICNALNAFSLIYVFRDIPFYS